MTSLLVSVYIENMLLHVDVVMCKVVGAVSRPALTYIANEIADVISDG